jgi:hypothetical protein
MDAGNDKYVFLVEVHWSKAMAKVKGMTPLRLRAHVASHIAT